ncbi:MAG: hypothetical protein KJZ64_01575 [Sphingomonadaceae bacterium]|nr:hypothetical protein [Sphingomonadaceae bacterium]
MRLRVDRLVGIAAVAGASLTVLAPVAAQAPTLAMLDRLDRGEWLVRFRDSGEQRRVCLRTGRELIQLRHGEAQCSRYVVEDGTGQVTVQYSCPGNGYGRTSVRRESGSLAQIESQGIADGKPFQFTAEGRRVGACR